MVELQAKAAELAVGEIEHRAGAVGRDAVWIERGVRKIHTGVAGTHAVVAHPHAPARHELVNRLQVAAGLCAGVIHRVDRAALTAMQQLHLQLEIGFARIAVRRPLPFQIGDADAAVAREHIGRVAA